MVSTHFLVQCCVDYDKFASYLDWRCLVLGMGCVVLAGKRLRGLGFGRGLEGVWKGFGRGLEGVWNGLRGSGWEEVAWFGRGLEGVWKGFGRGLEGVWKGFGRGLEGVWKGFGRGLEGVWKGFGRGLEGVWWIYAIGT